MKDWVLERIKTLKEVALTQNTNQIALSTEWLADKIKKPDDFFKPITPRDIIAGKFYLMFYNLKSNESKLDKYSITFIVDEKKYRTKRTLIGLNIHFIPIKPRVLFFNGFFNNTHTIFEMNENKESVLKEEPIPNMSFKLMNKLLEGIGFEYALRMYDTNLIDRCYMISVMDIDKLLLFNSQRMTGVNENKIAQIWEARLKEKNDRAAQFKKKLDRDWKVLKNEISKEIGDISKRIDNAEKSTKELNEFLKNKKRR